MARARGEGTVVQRSNGIWHAALQVNGVRKFVYGKTRREVVQKLNELKAQARAAGFLPYDEARTLADAVEHYLQHGGLRQSTVQTYRFYLQHAEQMMHLPLRRVTPDKLQALYTRLTPAVADRLHRILHRVFALAVRYGWLASNPCARVVKPAYKPAHKEVWTAEELRAFLQAEHWLNPLFVLLAGTGVRLGEALAMQWSDCDLEAGVAEVKGTLAWLNGKPVVQKPKTAASARVIALPQQVVHTLQEHKAKLLLEGRLNGWLFTSPKTGGPLRQSTVQRAMRETCRRLGLPQMTPHGLRHLHASLLLAEGLPLPAVSQRLGHANTQVTASVYAHALKGADRRAAEAISSLL